MLMSKDEMMNKIHTTFVNQAPHALGFTLRCIPFGIKRRVIEQLLDLQFKQSLADGDLNFLAYHWLKIEVTDLDLTWFVSLIDNHLQVSRAEHADVSFICNMNDLIKIATRRQDPDTLFFERRLIVEGDKELGLYVKNLMDSIELDTMPKSLQITLNKLADIIEKSPIE